MPRVSSPKTAAIVPQKYEVRSLHCLQPRKYSTLNLDVPSLIRNSPTLMPIQGEELNQMNVQATKKKGPSVIAMLMTLTLAATIACNSIGGQSSGAANGDLVFSG